MPILKSGRAVGIKPKNYVDEILFDENGELAEITFGYRPQISSKDDLLGLLPVMYFDVENDNPIITSVRKSGFTFKEISAGADNWSSSEIDEFKQWTISNTELQKWLEKQFTAIKLQESEDDAYKITNHDRT